MMEGLSMAGIETATVKAIVGYAASAVSAIGAIRQGNDAKAAADFNAAQLRIQGERDAELARRDAEDFADNESRKRASLRANVAGGGGTLEGTALLIEGDMAAEAAYQEARILAGGDTAQNRANNQATLERAKGKSAQQAGFLKAGGTLFKAAGEFEKKTKLGTG